MPEAKLDMAVAAIERARDQAGDASTKLAQEGAPGHTQRAVAQAHEDLHALLVDLVGDRRAA